MAIRPTVGTAAEEAYESMGPWAEQDTLDERYDLLGYLEGVFGGSRLQDLIDIVRDGPNGEPGWSSVLDLERAPSEWLPWLAQLGGARVLPGLDDAGQRARIAGTDGMKRGSPGALRAAAQQYLTGNKYVILNERLGGNAWQLGIRSLDSETPDPALVLNAINEQKPAGIVLSYATVPGQTYDALATAFDTYTDMEAAYATYSALSTNLPI